IIQNFKFIHAMGLVTGAILAARRAITELIEESRAFYEAMTVLQSTAMNFNEVLDELTVRARTLAQRFGQSIEEVTSIAYEFGSAGFSAEEAFRGMEDTMRAVVSTGADVTQITRSMAG